MKLQYFLISLFILGGIIFIAFRVYSANSAPLPEGFPSPTAAGSIEVKTYPPYREATYLVQGNLARASQEAFYPLYQHISSNKISMTAPVEARYPNSTLEGLDGANEKGEARVSFLYRNTKVYPKEIVENIKIEDIPAMTVVSLGCRGDYSYQSYQDGIAQLKEWLKKNPEYHVVGLPRRFFYDGPYIPDPLKRSEIQIPISK